MDESFNSQKLRYNQAAPNQRPNEYSVRLEQRNISPQIPQPPPIDLSPPFPPNRDLNFYSLSELPSNYRYPSQSPATYDTQTKKTFYATYKPYLGYPEVAMQTSSFLPQPPQGNIPFQLSRTIIFPHSEPLPPPMSYFPPLPPPLPREDNISFPKSDEKPITLPPLSQQPIQPSREKPMNKPSLPQQPKSSSHEKPVPKSPLPQQPIPPPPREPPFQPSPRQITSLSQQNPAPSQYSRSARPNEQTRGHMNVSEKTEIFRQTQPPKQPNIKAVARRPMVIKREEHNRGRYRSCGFRNTPNILVISICYHFFISLI